MGWAVDTFDGALVDGVEQLQITALLYDYASETGKSDTAGSEALFAPRCATVVSEHPITGDTKQFLLMRLDSTLSVAEFDSHYYDEHSF